MSYRDEYQKLQEKNLPSRGGVFAMMLLTGIYLMFEVAFAARLLDVVASTTALHEIEQIETAGRIISGIALTLVIWSVFLFPMMRRVYGRYGGKGFTLFLAAAACCAFSYYVQEEILKAISNNSSAEQRQAASTLTLISSSVQSEGALLSDFDFDVVGRDAPATKAFMALLPALALSVDDLQDRTYEAVDDLLIGQTRRALGDHEIMYLDVYYPTMEALKQTFNNVYFPAQQIRQSSRSESVATFDRTMEETFGRVLPHDLNARNFFDDPGVQAAWREKMGHPVEITLAADLTLEEFETDFYDAWVEHIVAESRPLYYADISLFEEGAEHYAAGIDAIRIAYVPLIAFGFSILGALVHAFKTMNFAAQAAIGMSSLYLLSVTKIVKLVLAALVLTAGVTMARTTNPVTESVLFVDLEQRSKDIAGPAFALALRSTIQLQSHIYPVAETIRQNLLLGITYDFDPETAVPAFEFFGAK